MQMKNVAIFLCLTFVTFLTINQEKALANYSKNGCYILVVQIDSTVDVFKAKNRHSANLYIQYLEKDFKFVEILKYCEGTEKYNKINTAIKNKQAYFFSSTSQKKEAEVFFDLVN